MKMQRAFIEYKLELTHKTILSKNIFIKKSKNTYMSLLKILVKPNKKTEKVYFEQENIFWDEEKLLIVETSAPPIDGKANTQVIEIVAKFLEIKKSQIKIKRGHTSKIKYLEIHSKI